ncbi:hypothetical protein ACWAOL_004654 [Vibrio parahaemolyticus]|uniref:hypothetical protein n=1 Tax=Vibrio harveyi group TaxID=717610 RepID=UPI0004A412E3|nr:MULTISPECIES: hypothetical protein [Vibrio harveyi group]EGQ9368664.1 hypothetical protein [Vibrio parahaemolyticus]EGR0735484.1 hypothetical protein [Vibrio parahaemolyticus]EGR0993203.1 hypothetical protein [Vibrio parahaemolyticus]EGR1199303.1 hypothetical protein [Vibrio parahaemolyticus]EGR1412875.1 hypothetical protein [Vibrio parahaemolyticus]
MKKLILATVLAASFSAQAAPEIIYNQGIFTLVKFSDEFTEKVTSCQLNIGEFARDKPRISLFSKPTKNFEAIGLAGSVGNYSGSGYQIKIDDGEMIQKGRTRPGGDATYGVADASMLNNIVNGNKLILRVHPDNQFVDTETEVYSLKGSSTAIDKFKSCLSGS